MTTINPSVAIPATGVKTITWANMATGDTISPALPAPMLGALASVQIAGTFGGSTVALKASEDDSTYLAVKDVEGTAVSATTAARFEVSTAALYLKPAISGGASDSVTVIVTVRG